MAYWFLKNEFLKLYSMHSYVNIRPNYDLTLPSWVMIFALPEDAVHANWFLRSICILYVHFLKCYLLLWPYPNIFSHEFQKILIIFFFNRVWSFISTASNPLCLGLPCATIGWNCLSGFKVNIENVTSLLLDERQTECDQKSS